MTPVTEKNQLGPVWEYRSDSRMNV
jgi:hypothetical protein